MNILKVLFQNALFLFTLGRTYKHLRVMWALWNLKDWSMFAYLSHAAAASWIWPRLHDSALSKLLIYYLLLIQCVYIQYKKCKMFEAMMFVFTFLPWLNLNFFKITFKRLQSLYKRELFSHYSFSMCLTVPVIVKHKKHFLFSFGLGNLLFFYCTITQEDTQYKLRIRK